MGDTWGGDSGKDELIVKLDGLCDALRQQAAAINALAQAVAQLLDDEDSEDGAISQRPGRIINK